MRQRCSTMTVSALALAMACLLCPRIASAQFDTATVLGVVVDATGARVPGATVTLRNADTGIAATTVTDSDGNYQFLNVRDRHLQRARRAAGLLGGDGREHRRHRQRPAARRPDAEGRRRRRNGRRDRRGAAARNRIERPWTGHRPRADRQPAAQRPRVRRPRAPEPRRAASRRSASRATRSFNVNGLRSALNNFILDGVDNNSYGTSNQGFSNQVVQVSPDAVEEFKVQTNNFSAEFGRAGGAVINATFRSGTNQFRGTVWEFNRNTSLECDRVLQAIVGRQADARPQPVRRCLRRAHRSRTARSSSPTTRASARCSARSRSPAFRRWPSGRGSWASRCGIR